jgi:CRP-like cAMP-binding protein
MPEQPVSIAEVIAPYVLQNTFVYENLPLAEKAMLEEASRQLTMQRGESLFRQGAFPKCAYLLHTGKVKIYTERSNSQKQTLYIYTDGDLLGYRQLLSEEPYPVSAELLEDSRISVIPAEAFRALVRESSFFSRNLLEAMAREFSVWMNRLTVFAQHPVQARLVLCLLILHEKYRQHDKPVTTITVTRTELAEYIGATLETVVRVLTPLKAAGLVAVSGRRLVLPHPEGLLGYLHS